MTTTTTKEGGRAADRVGCAEVVVRRGDTLLAIHHILPGDARRLWAGLAVALGGGLLAFGAATLALLGAGVGLASLVVGAAMVAAGRVLGEARGDTFRAGEAPGVDLPVALPGLGEAGFIDLCRVSAGGVIVGLPAGSVGSIVGRGAAHEIEALRGAGLTSYVLRPGERAELTLGPVRVDILSLGEGSLPSIALGHDLGDRRLWLIQGISALVLGGAFVGLANAPRAPFDLRPDPHDERDRIFRALAAMPPRERPRIELPAPPAPVVGPAEVRPSVAAPRRPQAQPPPPVLVEVEGAAVPAPRLRRQGKPLLRRGDDIIQVAAPETLAEGFQAAHDWGLAAQERSRAVYNDSKADLDAWAALTGGPPVNRGFGGLELASTGRQGGGRAEGTVALDPSTLARATSTSPREGESLAPRRAVVGGLRLGAPRVNGAIDAEHAGAVAQRNRPQLSRCWSEASARAPSLAGALTLQVTVGGAGKVAQVEVREAGVDAGFVRCLDQAVRSWRFDAPAGGAEAQVAYPIRYGAA